MAVRAEFKLSSKFNAFVFDDEDQATELEAEEILEKYQRKLHESSKKQAAVAKETIKPTDTKEKKANKKDVKTKPVLENNRTNQLGKPQQTNFRSTEFKRSPNQTQVDDSSRQASTRSNNTFQRDQRKPNDFRRREFDRHSGSDKTGVKPVMKRDGNGPRNWGNIKEELAAQKDVETDQLMEAANIDAINQSTKEGVEDAATKPAPEQEDVPPVEEVKMLTLEEFRSLQRSAGPTNRQVTRRANDGKNVFAGMKMYQKPAGPGCDCEDEETESGEEEKEEAVFNVVFNGQTKKPARRNNRFQKGSGFNNTGRREGQLKPSEPSSINAGTANGDAANTNNEGPLDLLNADDFPSLG